MNDQCQHEWVVVEESRSINEWTGLENGWQRCMLCHTEAHFTRDPDPVHYPALVAAKP